MRVFEKIVKEKDINNKFFFCLHSGKYNILIIKYQNEFKVICE